MAGGWGVSLKGNEIEIGREPVELDRLRAEAVEFQNSTNSHKRGETRLIPPFPTTLRPVVILF